jgi:hypothetical protein
MGPTHRQESMILVVIGALMIYGCWTVFGDVNYSIPRFVVAAGPGFVLFGILGIVFPANYFYKIDPKYNDLPISVLFKTEKTRFFWIALVIVGIAAVASLKFFEFHGYETDYRPKR